MKGDEKMPLILMEKYCVNCGFSYVDDEDIPEDEDVIQIICDCDKIHVYHRCKDKETGKTITYSPMKVREVHAHEIEERKKSEIPHCPNCKWFSLIEECIPNQRGECDYQPIKDKCDCDVCKEEEEKRKGENE